MIVGVILFNVAQGQLGSLMSSSDEAAEYEQKLDTLNEINKDYPLPSKFMQSLQKQLQY